MKTLQYSKKHTDIAKDSIIKRSTALFLFMAMFIVIPYPVIKAKDFGMSSYPQVSSTEPKKRPNIVILYSDDQRTDTIRALGNKHIHTPNLDNLVREGTTFTQTYVMGSPHGAVCIPSRAMLLTGRSLFRVNLELKDQRTWLEQFADAGYRTFISGKWHNGGESVRRVFQQGKAIFLGGMTHEPFKATIQDMDSTKQFVNRRITSTHPSQLFTDAAVSFLNEQSNGKPFLCYVAFNLPHDPRVAPENFHKQYDAAKIPLPENYLPQHPFNSGDLTTRDEKLEKWPRTPEAIRQHIADYYAAITFVDSEVGRIVNTLKQKGLYENTLIVFAGDNGLALGSHGLMGKQSLYEHSIGVPMLMVGQGIPKNRRSDKLCYLYDILPTLGELANVSAPDGNEGKSLLPAMSGRSVRDDIFTAYADLQRAVRDERWKLIAYTKINKVALFDLKNDPAEKNDLSTDPKHKATYERLWNLLEEKQREAGDKLPLRSTTPLPLEFDFSKVKLEE